MHKKTLIIIFGAIFTLGLFNYLRPLPNLQPEKITISTSPANKVAISWPKDAQAAVGALGYGLLAKSGPQKPVPTASVAKIVTALTILRQKPLAFNQQGPAIKLDNTDVDLYNDYLSKGGSVAKVVSGESLTEYQALQALLVKSANNIADTLSVWAFGTKQEFLKQANLLVKDLGMNQTYIADASGFSDKTISTPEDLISLGQAALDNPVIAKIIAMPSANIPVAGNLVSLNRLLGTDGFIGIKTGNTTAAGGCYLFAAKKSVAGENVTIVGAVMGAIDLDTAISEGQNLANATTSGFTKISLLRAGQTVGYYRSDWGIQVPAIAQNDLSILTWSNKEPVLNIRLDQASITTKKNDVVGAAKISVYDKSSHIPIVLDNDIAPPSWTWRLVRRNT